MKEKILERIFELKKRLRERGAVDFPCDYSCGEYDAYHIAWNEEVKFLKEILNLKD